MGSSAKFLNASDAARALGVSVKALRLYEQRGLVSPVRTAAGWRTYGPAEMKRAREIAALRGLGFSLAQVERVLRGDLQGLEVALAAHQATLEEQARGISGMVERVHELRARLAKGEAPDVGELARLQAARGDVVVAFDLPWPWGGERFELRALQPLTYIIGPLGSGKTRLAQRLAETLPNAAFLGLDRASGGAEARARMDADAALKARVEEALAWLVEDGAALSDALVVLLAALESDAADIWVVDMIEQGLDEVTQQALVAHLRRRGAGGRPVFAMTRSSAILDLGAVGRHEAIILCPANHSPPMHVSAYPGAPGYEAVATCLAPPDVRARTEGVIAWRPPAA